MNINEVTESNVASFSFLKRILHPFNKLNTKFGSNLKSISKVNEGGEVWPPKFPGPKP